MDHSKEMNTMLNHHTGGTVHFGVIDISVSPHDKLALLGRSQTVAYYRQGGNSVPIPADLQTC